jgi:hypothetical protein
VNVLVLTMVIGVTMVSKDDVGIGGNWSAASATQSGMITWKTIRL